MRWLLIVAIASLTITSSPHADSLPSVPAPEMLLPENLIEVAMGAPADSVVLRVSFYALPIGNRFDGNAYLVVEELPWPPPDPGFHFVIGDTNIDKSEETPVTKSNWTASRIEGAYLNRIRRENNVRIVSPGFRDGEIGGLLIRPFRLAKWISPHRFVVTDGRAFFEIEWEGPGRLELLSVRSEL